MKTDFQLLRDGQISMFIIILSLYITVIVTGVVHNKSLNDIKSQLKQSVVTVEPAQSADNQ